VEEKQVRWLYLEMQRGKDAIMKSKESLSPNRGVRLPTVECPNCRMIWLAPGLLQGDTYECRSCGVSFVISESPDRTLQDPMKKIQLENDSNWQENG
jgi:predicted RNA-binding Zn-ribbon protein involved in translation (DUF1610 family)